MRHKSGARGSGSEQIIRTIKRKTRRQHSAEEIIRIVLDDLRGEDSILELCRREGLSESIYYKWSKEFMEAGKKRLSGDIVREASTDEGKGLRREARDLKECVADLTLESRLLKKKHDRGWGRRRMRYPASEKLEIIRIVERSHLPIKVTLDKLGVSRSTFYRWYELYQRFGEQELEDKRSGPNRAWNRVPDDVRARIIDLALDEQDLSPRGLAVTFTDTQDYFVSESSVYRLLKAHDL